MAINETVRENMITLGREGGKGADSIIKAAMFSTALVANKMAEKSDARDLYLAYCEGYNEETIFAQILGNEDSLKSQVSAFGTFLLPDVIKNGEIHGLALILLKTIEPKDRRNGSYNSLVAINRAQKKKGPKALTNDEMREVLEKDEAVEKDLVAKLTALLKTANKIAKDYGTDAPGLFAIVKLIDKSVEAAKAAALAGDAGKEEEDGEDTSEEVIQQDKLTLVVDNGAAVAAVVSADGKKETLAGLLSNLGRVSVN